MLTLPVSIMNLLQPFRPVLSERVWDWAQVLVVGAILAPGRRTVTAILCAVGLSQDKQFQNYHRVLNRAQWSSLRAAKILLGLLVQTFVASGGVVVIGADETLERRRGAKIWGLGCFRDAARSSRGNKVKSFGLRWVSMMLLVRVPWSQRVWALPFLTVLAPNAKTHQASGKRHKTSIDWIGQMVLLVRRWLPERRIVLIVDGALSALKLGYRCVDGAMPITLVMRLQHNARFFDEPPTVSTRGRRRVVGARQPKPKDVLADRTTVWQRVTVRWYDGRARVLEMVSQRALWYTTGQRPLLGRWVVVRDPLGTLEPCVLFATDPDVTPEQIVAWYSLRWSVEVTYEEVRAQLGFETQRQWNPLAIARTSPALLGLFSLVTLLAHHLMAGQPFPQRTTAWYTKSEATFADVLALVRHTLWTECHFPRAAPPPDSAFIPQSLLGLWVDLLCYAT